MKWQIAILVMAAATAVQATEIYRWSDEMGHVHFSDSVPERYKSSAVRIEWRVNRGTAAEREQARALAEREKAQAAELARQRQSVPQPVAAAFGPPQTIPQPVAGNADCAQSYQAYRQSQECFAPFIQANGSVKAEAYAQCGEPVLNPSQKCGPPQWN
ncbi:DUF4124 domain-containing protein [Piscinibacter terrae]|nr:DUF4124 domain-containing protein [Albitalea terrae]